MPADDTEEVCAAGRLVLKTLEQAGGVEALSAAHEAVAAHHGNNYLPLLDQLYRSSRSALFDAAGRDRAGGRPAPSASVVDAVGFLRALRGAKAAYVPERLAVDDPARGRWRLRRCDRRGRLRAGGLAQDPADKDRAGMLVRRHLEVCVFSYLAAELRVRRHRGGRVGLLRQLADQLMTWEECEPLIGGLLRRGRAARLTRPR